MINTTYYQDLTKMNTFGMKVKARCFMEYDSVADLVDIEFEELARPVLHIGGGSNLLFTDDFKGTILHSKINFIEILEDASEVLVSVGSGVVFDDFCAWAAKEGLWGVENLSYIPGEVGASAVQNIGAYGVEVKDVIRKVYCYDTVEEEFVSFGVEECGYGYRDSIFKNPEVKGRYIVTHVVFALSRTPQPKLDYGHLRDAVMASSARHCEEGQSPDVAICLIKVPAAWLIEQCGWKGRRSGGAAVYDKQPLVIVNYTGDAYPEEILGLERRIIASVKAKFDIDLHPEVEHV